MEIKSPEILWQDYKDVVAWIGENLLDSADEKRFPEICEDQKWVGFHKMRRDIFVRVLRLQRRIEKNEDEKAFDELEKIVVRAKKYLHLLRESKKTAMMIDEISIGGKCLRKTQKLVAERFYAWLENNVMSHNFLGRVVKPMGTGKTTTAVLLTEMMNARKTVFFAHNKNTANQAVSAFREHNGRSVGECFGGKKDLSKDVTVALFESAFGEWGSFDWDNVDLVVVDEADVNGLSKKRRVKIKALAEKYDVQVVAMSATEEQGSGKLLKEIYPDEILAMGIPDSLAECVEMGILCDMNFRDLYVDVEAKIDPEDKNASGDVSDEQINKITESANWNSAILDDFLENYRDESTLVVFRNNFLVGNFVKQAAERGVKAAAFTGQETAEQRKVLNEKHKSGEIRILVGSRLLERGHDAPWVSVIYNSTVTWSPQVFWQANGRGMRVDPDNAEKVAKIIAVIPARMIDLKSGEELENFERPYSNAAFFEEGYYDGKERVEREAFTGGESKKPKDGKVKIVKPKDEKPEEEKNDEVYEIQNVKCVRTTQDVVELRRNAREVKILAENIEKWRGIFKDDYGVVDATGFAEKFPNAFKLHKYFGKKIIRDIINISGRAFDDSPKNSGRTCFEDICLRLFGEYPDFIGAYKNMIADRFYVTNKTEFIDVFPSAKVLYKKLGSGIAKDITGIIAGSLSAKFSEEKNITFYEQIYFVFYGEFPLLRAARIKKEDMLRNPIEKWKNKIKEEFGAENEKDFLIIFPNAKSLKNKCALSIAKDVTGIATKARLSAKFSEEENITFYEQIYFVFYGEFPLSRLKRIGSMKTNIDKWRKVFWDDFKITKIEEFTLIFRDAFQLQKKYGTSIAKEITSITAGARLSKKFSKSENITFYEQICFVLYGKYPPSRAVRIAKEEEKKK